MRRKDTVKYWKDAAKGDYESALILYKAGKYSQALFFCHLSIEKLLKALYFQKHAESPPYTHNLLFIWEKIRLRTSIKIREDLRKINSYNLNERYPEEREIIRSNIDAHEAEAVIKLTEAYYSWLRRKFHKKS